MPTSLVVGLALVVAAPALKERPGPDAASPVGRWVIDSVTVAGQVDKTADGTTIELTADGKLTFQFGAMEVAGTYKTNPRTVPAQFDPTVGAAGASFPLLGIYKVEKDALTLCLVLGGNRPTAFEAPAASNTLLLILKRAK